MLFYSPLILTVISFGLLGPSARAEPFRAIVMHSDSVSNDLSKDNASGSDGKDPATIKYIRKNTLTLSYRKKNRNVFHDFFLGSQHFSMPLTSPSDGPTMVPSDEPTPENTFETTIEESAVPSDGPSLFPSDEPTTMDSLEPTRKESAIPSDGPSILPSDMPTPVESAEPTTKESTVPSDGPSIASSGSMSPVGSNEPSSASFEPSLEASTVRSEVPSVNPSSTPIDSPSANPSFVPIDIPSESPSSMPSTIPSENPSSAPIGSPSTNPSSMPIDSLSTNPTIASEDPEPTSFPSFSLSMTFTSSNVTDDFFEDSETSTFTEIPSSNETSVPSSSPTLEECLITEEAREAEILVLLDAVGDPSKIRDLTTPQGLAADWLIHQDFRKECPTPKIVQRWVIAVFYFSTNGESWEQCSAAGSDPCGSQFPFEGARRFLSDFSECEWGGITCDNDDCVTEIEFEENALVGTIPTELGLLEELAVLGMERGGLSSTIPTEIGLLTKLIFIDLDYNELTGTLPVELYSLTNLETLDLNDNLLEGDINSIGVLQRLQFLQLQSNQFTGTIPEEIGGLAMMNTFNLHENSFSGTMPESVCDLRQDNGGFLQSLIADCGNSSGLGPTIQCDCCSSCRG